MAKGPQGQQRPDDPARAAVMVVRLATGEITETLGEAPAAKDPAAVALGRRGGLRGGAARAQALSPEEKRRIARKAAAARWGRDKIA
jgi:hypothetical protein